jgi:hypothetical protein
MAHHKKDRLWKFEDSWTKLELYVSGYAYEPKVDQIRCDVLAKSKHFSGQYVIVIAWREVFKFATACEMLVQHPNADSSAAFSPEDYANLSIVAKAIDGRKIRWQIVCSPIQSPIEVFNLQVTTEHQLLNSIMTGAEKVWRRWPGPSHVKP